MELPATLNTLTRLGLVPSHSSRKHRNGYALSAGIIFLALPRSPAATRSVEKVLGSLWHVTSSQVCCFAVYYIANANQLQRSRRVESFHCHAERSETESKYLSASRFFATLRFAQSDRTEMLWA